MSVKCVWLDGGARKACGILKARLGPLGIKVVCRSSLPDEIIDGMARRDGCAVVTTDKEAAARFGWILLDFGWVEHKSARDIATRVLKLIRLQIQREVPTR